MRRNLLAFLAGALLALGGLLVTRDGDGEPATTSPAPAVSDQPERSVPLPTGQRRPERRRRRTPSGSTTSVPRRVEPQAPAVRPAPATTPQGPAQTVPAPDEEELPPVETIPPDDGGGTPAPPAHTTPVQTTPAAAPPGSTSG